MGAVESLNSLCVAVGLALGGALVAVSSPRAAFLVIGLGIMVSAVALYLVSSAAPAAAVDGGDHAAVLESPIGTVQALQPVERAQAPSGNGVQPEAQAPSLHRGLRKHLESTPG